MPNIERSVQVQPSKQSSGSSEQFATKQEWLCTVSQKLASPPAQSLSVAQLLPKPVGGRLHTLGCALVSQAYPPEHSLELVQPIFVQ